MSSAAEFYENRKEHWENYIKDHAERAIQSFHDETGVPVEDVWMNLDYERRTEGWVFRVRYICIDAGKFPDKEKL
jgi:hypothetical protein